jgi:hypothetical protein
MRLVPLIAIVLLLVGFVARPTTATALTDGHFLNRTVLASMLHQAPSKIVLSADLKAASPEHEHTADDSHGSSVSCLAGILPVSCVLIGSMPREQFTPQFTGGDQFRVAYPQLRPPQASAPLSA